MKWFILLLLFPLILYSDAVQTNILMYGGGDTQVSSELNEYKTIVAGMPIHGTIMVTHDAKAIIDPKSFRLGNDSLPVELIQSTSMSSFSNLQVTTFKFVLQGLPKGVHKLEPINVNVGGTQFQAAPLMIEVE